jgi:hypothetical protein
MMRKQRMSALLAVALGVVMAVPAWADCRNRNQLSITPAGAAIDASGSAEARADGAQQRFKVSIDARVADGTTFEVFANGQLAGTITVALGRGEVDLNTNDGAVLPAGSNPVCGITTVEVSTASGTVILQGSL